jgi:SAM-dependent methyltransferase
LPLTDNTTLERLVPDELLKHEATGAETLTVHIQRYEFAARRLRDAHSVLDIACGVGYGSRLLKDFLPAAMVTGVDCSAEAIDYATARYARAGLSFLVADAMAFEGGPFDAVVSLETIEHLPDPEKFVERSAAKLLRPGGIFVGSVPVTPSMDANPHHLNDFTASSFSKLLAAHSLTEFDRLQQVQPYSPLAVLTRNERRMLSMRPNLLAYYCQNPDKALLRLKSLVVDGFNNKYLTIAARSAVLANTDTTSD